MPLAVGDPEDLGSLTLREHGLLPPAIKPVAPGQAPQPFFVGSKLGLETGVGGKVDIQPGHFFEGNDPVEFSLGYQLGHTVDEILVAVGIGPPFAPKRFDLYSFRLVSLPGARTDGDIMFCCCTFLCYFKAIALLSPVREIIITCK